jgi:hypothetical protein
MAAFKSQIISRPKLDRIVISIKEASHRKTTSLMAWQLSNLKSSHVRNWMLLLLLLCGLWLWFGNHSSRSIFGTKIN